LGSDELIEPGDEVMVRPAAATAAAVAEGVISRSEIEDDTAEFAGVLKFLEARRTFQNWTCHVSSAGSIR
jgi:hypothetical protein